MYDYSDGQSEVVQTGQPSTSGVGRKFVTFCWVALTGLLIYYSLAALIPFFVLGIYRMSVKDMIDSPLTFPDPSAAPACLLTQCLILPLLAVAIFDTIKTWRSASGYMRMVRLLGVSVTILVIIVSYINGPNLYSWGMSFEAYVPP